MSDNEIRELERQLDVLTTDERQHLERLWLRAGRGWHGETLVEDLHATEERGVYVWTRHGLNLEMVRVPEGRGDVIASAARDNGSTLWVRIVETAFYIGRYPVTDKEWEVAYDKQFSPSRPLRHYFGHPKTNVTYTDARKFCAWVGLRLPIADEWIRAALGKGAEKYITCKDCAGVGFRGERDGRGIGCTSCNKFGKHRRKYPWGNETPTPERCVSAWWDQTPSSRLSVEPARSTLPVRTPDEHPARPDGAAPCGAHDMYGHIWEMDMSGAAHGGSFRGIGETYLSPMNRTMNDDVGFRVAL